MTFLESVFESVFPGLGSRLLAVLLRDIRRPSIRRVRETGIGVSSHTHVGRHRGSKTRDTLQ